MKKKPEPHEPSPASLRLVPEIEFEQYGPARANPFAGRMRREGWEVVHEGPRADSLLEIPEIDFSRQRPRGRRKK